jgi:RHS repeat-associated protein
MSLTRFRRRWAAPLSLLMIITFFATLLPPRRAAADTGAPAAGSSIGGGLPNLTSPPSPPNSPEAQATVDLSTGAATASFPFQLPHARGDAQPALALVYNSSNTVGFAGLGWTLAMSSIVRKGASGMPSFYDDPVASPLDSFADEYYVDGHLLVPVSPRSGEVMPAWASGGWIYFRTEIDDGRRYFFSPNGKTWRVQTKSGHLLEYGHPTDGAFSDGVELVDATTAGIAMLSTAGQSPSTSSPVLDAPSSNIYRWNLVRDTDATSNTVSYVWSTMGSSTPLPNGVQYLTDIYDTLDSAAGSLVPSSVYAHHTHLSWTPSTTQAWSVYSNSPQDGASFNPPTPQTTAIDLPSPIWRAVPQLVLSGVDVTSAGWSSFPLTMVRRYHLTYGTNSLHTQTLLQNITLEGECATAVTEQGGLLPPTSCPLLGGTTPLVSYTYTPDVQLDANGAPVLMAAPSVTLSPAATPNTSGGLLAAPTYISQSNPWQPSDAPHAFVDVNGDGRPDLIYGALNGDHLPMICNPNCYTDPVTGNAVTGPYGMFVDYAPAVDQSDEDWLSDPTNAASASPWDLAPGSTRMAYGNWLPSGKPSWLDFPPSSSSYQIYTPHPFAGTRGNAPFATGSYSLAATANFLIPSGTTVPNWNASNVADVDGDGLVDMQLVTDGSGAGWTYLTATDRASNLQPFARKLPVSAPPPINAGLGAVDYNTITDQYNNLYLTVPSQVFLTDMNGDGLSDYVVAYFLPETSIPPGIPSGYLNEFPPGPFFGIDVYTNRGNGTFGNDYSTYPLTSPYTLWGPYGGPAFGTGSSIQQSIESVQFGDLNGDGLADLTLYADNGFVICLRTGVPGAAPGRNSFACSSAFQISEPNTPDGQLSNPPLPFINDIVDLDGTGLPHAVLGTSGLLQSWQVLKTRANLLSSVKSYTSLETDFTYKSAVAAATNAPQDMPPVPVWMVASQTTTNGLDPNQYVQARSVTTNYSYNQAVYDAHDREFVGFQTVTEETVSSDPAHAPGHIRQTFYATTACTMAASLAVGPSSCTGNVDYSQFRLTRGLPIAVTETSDTTHDLLGVTQTGYQWQITTGSNGHTSTIAQPYIVYAYHPEAGTPASYATISAIQASNVTVVPSASAYIPVPQMPPILHEYNYDIFGNETAELDFGQYGNDSLIETTFTPGLPAGDPTGWNYRTMQRTVQTPGNALQRTYSYVYNAQGQRTQKFGQLAGTRTLPASPLGSGSTAQNLGLNLSSNGNVLLETVNYDPTYGNVSSIQSPNNRCTSFTYDPLFGQLTQSITTGACTGGLTKTFAFDRGLEVITQLTTAVASGAIAHLTSADYDGFGRLSHLYQPSDVVEGIADPTPAITATYVDQGPVRSVTTQTIDGPAPGAAGPYHIQFIDGFDDTIARIDQTGPEGGGSQWTLSGVRSRYDNGLVKAESRPSSYLTTPWDPPIGAFNGPTRGFTYDALGRPLKATDFENNTTTYSYQAAQDGTPAAVTILDPDQSSGVRPGSSTSAFINGRGQVVSKKVVVASTAQGAGTVTTTNTYLPTGELTAVTQSYTGGSMTRAMTYDTLGRLVFNQEPNTSSGGTSGWTYAYNDNGDLVGMRDARGCGQNLYYDPNGRYYAADYQPCDKRQPTYTLPSLLGGKSVSGPGDGTEVYVRYDANGRIAQVMDRAEHTRYTYDFRDRVTQVAEWLAPPGSPSSSLSARYTAHEYDKNITAYSEANRITSYTTGASAPVLMQGGAAPTVNLNYTYEGTLQSINSSYGTLLAAQSYWPDGSLNTSLYGDLAQTTATMTSGPNGEIQSYSVKRAGPWSTFPGYSNTGGVTNSLQRDLADQTLSYDAVGNVKSIADTADPSQWSPGTLPVSSRTYKYWDDYRMQLATYDYAGGADTQVPPYQAEENNTSSTVSTQGPLTAGTYPTPAAIASGMPVSNRIRSQQYGYDWRGNITSSTDDTDVFMDRSLGAVQLNAGTDQLWLASGDANTIDFSGTTNAYANTAYDAAGNLTYLWNSNTDSYYFYRWDEVGQLSYAAREDDVGMIEEDYAYDASGSRVRATNHRFVGAAETDDNTIQVFDTLVLDRAAFNVDYVDDANTENIYIALGGAGFAHVFYDDTPNSVLPQGGLNGSVHAYLAIGDTQGSTSFVIDHDTGELVEHITYQASGAIESDYRPNRWRNFREDIRHSGHWDDAEVGLIYLGARYYAPQLGRFISPDPLAIHGGGSDNPYEYAHGSPARYTDPFGLQSEGDSPLPVGDPECIIWCPQTAGKPPVQGTDLDTQVNNTYWQHGPTQNTQGTVGGGAASAGGAGGAAGGGSSGQVPWIPQPRRTNPWDIDMIKLFEGYVAHWYIGQYYAGVNKTQEVILNRTIMVIGGYPAPDNTRPDIANKTLFWVFEIKPDGQDADAVTQATGYVRLLGAPPWRLGDAGAPGTFGTLPILNGRATLEFQSKNPGAITYVFTWTPQALKDLGIAAAATTVVVGVVSLFFGGGSFEPAKPGGPGLLPGLTPAPLL